MAPVRRGDEGVRRIDRGDGCRPQPSDQLRGQGPRAASDVEDARSLDDALRAIVATGADVESRWDVEQVLDAGDRATGTTAFHDTYRTLALAPGTVDLPALWSRLGVHLRDAVVERRIMVT